MRGNFPRGWNDDASVDANRTIGDVQLDAFQGHFHDNDGMNYMWARGGGGIYATPTGGTDFDRRPVGVRSPTTDGTNGTPRTAAETRPRNVSLMATIRYSA
jgi:hypothetical protein